MYLFVPLSYMKIERKVFSVSDCFSQATLWIGIQTLSSLESQGHRRLPPGWSLAFSKRQAKPAGSRPACSWKALVPRSRNSPEEKLRTCMNNNETKKFLQTANHKPVCDPSKNHWFHWCYQHGFKHHLSTNLPPCKPTEGVIYKSPKTLTYLDRFPRKK